ncbi:MAG TPA: ImmA/IrrE family metallo-endopeptidase [Albidovulum sp.]|uniref:ImmA/IrrE family metallo-endopeptidase n=1 Tax=Albidovulum sp. TaxID=1872424 RepID=UPI002B7DD4F8|nr:ImmA/IrrE family metallo-endopeptidase [Albidovulum sp.]
MRTTLTADARNFLERECVRENQDMVKLAGKLGLLVEFVDLPPDLSGRLVRDYSAGTKSGFKIEVNKYQTYTRQRYTIAHEMGHFVMDGVAMNRADEHAEMSMRREPFTGQEYEARERRADRFAAECLMPKTAVSECMTGFRGRACDLARVFGVSESAMRWRLRELGLVLQSEMISRSLRRTSDPYGLLGL